MGLRLRLFRDAGDEVQGAVLLKFSELCLLEKLSRDLSGGQRDSPDDLKKRTNDNGNRVSFGVHGYATNMRNTKEYDWQFVDFYHTGGEHHGNSLVLDANCPTGTPHRPTVCICCSPRSLLSHWPLVLITFCIKSRDDFCPYDAESEVPASYCNTEQRYPGKEA